MTNENWINVAMIIAVIMTAAATLVGPVLAVYVQVRMTQPRPTPVANQPKNLIQRIGRVLKRHFKTFAFSYLMLSLDIFLLIRELRDPGPLARPSVFAIAVYAAVATTIFLFIVLAGSFKLIAELLHFTARSFGESLRFDAAHFSLSLAIFAMVDELHLATISTLEKPIPRPASRDEAIAVIKEIKELAISRRSK